MMNESTILEAKPKQEIAGLELNQPTTEAAPPARRRPAGRSSSFTLMCLLAAAIGLLAVKTQADMARLNRMLDGVQQDLERGIPVGKASAALMRHKAQ